MGREGPAAGRPARPAATVARLVRCCMPLKQAAHGRVPLATFSILVIDALCTVNAVWHDLSGRLRPKYRRRCGGCPWAGCRLYYGLCRLCLEVRNWELSTSEQLARHTIKVAAVRTAEHK